ncbi:hypothetical protein CIPAW_01G230800 [Carya illinoinensis]|uniref:Uncharacterized protein n=1 Tax=Carya illinoinensis TaxID=32201 RepID=A0A8T1RR92_CARIL|nr:hypothetical protein CIPAW_01G230800 [Carya illinoinensis]
MQRKLRRSRTKGVEKYVKEIGNTRSNRTRKQNQDTTTERERERERERDLNDVGKGEIGSARERERERGGWGWDFFPNRGYFSSRCCCLNLKTGRCGNGGRHFCADSFVQLEK